MAEQNNELAFDDKKAAENLVRHASLISSRRWDQISGLKYDDIRTFGCSDDPSSSDDIKACTSKSVPVDSTKDKKTGYRKVGFLHKKGKHLTYLKFSDIKHTEYKVPLGIVPTQKVGENNKHENILIPVVPKCVRPYMYAITPNTLKTQPDMGYIYVFKDGYLWREFAVVGKGIFHEINLAKIDNFSKPRTPTAAKDNRIILPYKISGEIPKIEMGYFITQLSWERINALGGMDPDDPRLKFYPKKPLMPTDHDIDNSKATQRREERLQLIDLRGYEKSKSFDVQYISDGKAQNAIVNSTNKEDNTPEKELHRKSGIAAVHLHDPIGSALWVNDEIDKRIAILNKKMHEIQGLVDQEGDPIGATEVKDLPEKLQEKYRQKKANYEIGLTLNSLLYQGVDKTMNNPDIWKSIKEPSQKAFEKRKSWREKINKPLLQKEFESAYCYGVIDTIVKLREILVEILDEKVEHCNFTVSMYDLFASGYRGYNDALQVIAKISENILKHPALDYTPLVFEEKYMRKLDESNQHAEDFMMRLHGVHPDEPSHKLFFCIYPSDEAQDKTQTNVPAGLARFNSIRFDKWIAEEKNYRDAGQITRRISQILNAITLPFLNAAFIREGYEKSNVNLKEKKPQNNVK